MLNQPSRGTEKSESTGWRNFLGAVGVGAAALASHAQMANLFADENRPSKNDVMYEVLEIPENIRSSLSPDDLKALQSAIRRVRFMMESTPITDDFEQSFESHIDLSKNADTFRRKLRQGAALSGKKADKDGVVEGSVLIKEKRVFGSITCRNGYLTVSISIVPLEYRKVVTSPTEILSQSSEFVQYGLAPMGCAVTGEKGEQHGKFRLGNGGTGTTSVDGVSFPFSIKLVPGETEEPKKEQRTVSPEAWTFDVVLS